MLFPDGFIPMRQDTGEDQAGAPESVPPPPKSVTEHLAFIRRLMPDLLREASASVERNDLPLLHWGPDARRVDHLAPAFLSGPVAFVGDIHGDYLALFTLAQVVFQNPDARLVFLGDLVDRGPYSLECFAALLHLILNNPSRVVWIAGNHDTGVSWNAEVQTFSSDVSPSEFSEFLNSSENAETLVQWGKLFVNVVSMLPRALLFPDGLLATHGGVPLGDRFSALDSLDSLNQADCLEDFTWTRAVPYPRRLGWKIDTERRLRSSAFEFGYEDLWQFCEVVRPFYDVARLVRGHDHVPDALDIPEQYKKTPLMTLNGFGFDYLTCTPQTYRPSLLWAEYLPGEEPRIHSIGVDPVQYRSFYWKQD